VIIIMEVTIVEINIVAVTTVEVNGRWSLQGGHHSGSNYSGHRFRGSHQDANKPQPRWRTKKGSAHFTEKASNEGGAANLYSFIADTAEYNMGTGF
jgi:hypothetical protein